MSVGATTLGQWFVDEYLFGPLGGGNTNVSGYYFDDSWGAGGCSEIEQHQLADMGLSSADVAEIAAFEGAARRGRASAGKGVRRFR